MKSCATVGKKSAIILGWRVPIYIYLKAGEYLLPTLQLLTRNIFKLITVNISKLKVCRKFNPFYICIVVFVEKCRNENTLKQFWKDLGLFYCPFNCYAQGMPRNSIKAQIGRFNWKFFYGKRIDRVKSRTWGKKITII